MIIVLFISSFYMTINIIKLKQEYYYLKHSSKRKFMKFTNLVF